MLSATPCSSSRPARARCGEGQCRCRKLLEKTCGLPLMATAFSAHSFSFVPLPPAVRITSKNLNTVSISSPFRHTSGRTLSVAFRTLGAPRNSRKSFGFALKVAETDPKTINGNGESAETNDSKRLTGQNSNLKFLTESYKKAILDGDEKTVSEIEASIYILEKEMNELYIKTAKLTSEIASAKDKFLRINADLKNFRKSTEKDMLSFTADIRAEVVEHLLPLIDNFERAKHQTKPETEREKKIDSSYQGIYKQFVEIMRSMRVSVVETVGRPFDPSIHEAIAREESNQFKSGIVMQELRRGFYLCDQVLRPAIVKVSTGPRSEKGDSVNVNCEEQPALETENSEETVSTSSVS
ncbi:hypothetical protein HPP92_005741 [Vanilla planifolia]|uniref:GrpE protein homolog n=1 Tax=Vanilla planifolia TaxID=51239 RepID=A0A835RKU0_VANPL|nr:hypothetical protein HPP92_005741 [Vanilla planifolia]